MTLLVVGSVLHWASMTGLALPGMLLMCIMQKGDQPAIAIDYTVHVAMLWQHALIAQFSKAFGVALQITAGYCPKTWEVKNTLTDTTTGNFCSGKKYSSMYSCAANCRWNSSALDQPDCAGLPDKLSYTSGECHRRTIDLQCHSHEHNHSCWCPAYAVT